MRAWRSAATRRKGAVAGLAGALGGGVGDAPVDLLANAAEIGADLADSVAEGDHVVEAISGELVEVLAAPARHVDAVLGHHTDCVRVQVLGAAAGAGDLDPVAGSVREEGFGDLGAGTVSGAGKQHPYRGGATATTGRGRDGGQAGVQC